MILNTVFEDFILEKVKMDENKKQRMVSEIKLTEINRYIDNQMTIFENKTETTLLS